MAASARIIYAPGSIGGLHLANAVRYTILAQQEANRAFNVAAAVTAGGVTQANLEGSQEFAAAVAQGAVLYSAIVSLQTALNAITASQLGNLDSGT